MSEKRLPPQIRTDPSNEFAHNTVTTRLPRNIRNIISGNRGFPRSVAAALEDLASLIEGDGEIPALPLPAWDAERWEEERLSYRGASWHDVDWFFAETYAFRLILSCTRYFENGIDPYAPMKHRELEAGSPFLPLLRFFGSGGAGHSMFDPGARGEFAVEAALEEAIHLSMWANRADISFVAGGELDHSVGARELLLADESSHAAQLLPAGASPVHIVMDNAGAELTGDLVLAVTIVHATGAPVVLHPKFYPTYVSDTTPEDIRLFLAAAAEHPDPVVRAFYAAARAAVDSGELTIAPDPYWCETRFLTDLPARLTEPFAEAAMVIVKGDFNYRRAMRDRIWPAGTPLADAMGLASGPLRIPRLAGTPWLFLRTMKSDCLAGVEAATVSDLDRSAPGWRTDGRRGVIQLVR
ncbi:MAG: ARMT1-like domain-containing protein [Alkalispirochaetaceae bacterium]